MKKIDTQAAIALSKFITKDFGNTRVGCVVGLPSQDIAHLFLFGNHIATYEATKPQFCTKNHGNASLVIDTKGYPTVTTHSRINALFNELGIHASIHKKGDKSILKDRNGNVIAEGKRVTYTFDL